MYIVFVFCISGLQTVRMCACDVFSEVCVRGVCVNCSCLCCIRVYMVERLCGV